jgi:hypothetical protein
MNEGRRGFSLGFSIAYLRITLLLPGKIQGSKLITLRFFIGLTLAGTLMLSMAAEEDPLVSEFHFDVDATGSTHKFWMTGKQYLCW